MKGAPPEVRMLNIPKVDELKAHWDDSICKSNRKESH
jgi:hypothetical protein